MDTEESQRNYKQSDDELRILGLQTIQELETDQGILASGKEELYGCIFGRDSLITSLKLLKAYQKTSDAYFLSLVKKVLVNLAALQGQTHNIESGEEPGKIIHEHRTDKHEHLTGRENKPWYLYPDNTMRSYDSVDSTLLFLIAIARFYKLSGDEQFLSDLWPHTESALKWMLSNASKHKYGFLSYQFPTERVYGGLETQSWMDSFDSIFHEDGGSTSYPIAPAEVQSYAYLACRLWQKELESKDHLLEIQLGFMADSLKIEFNKHFVRNGEQFEVAFAIDGLDRPMLSPRSSMGHLLWSAMVWDLDNTDNCILESVYIPRLVTRIFSPDLFEPEAGIRTLSKNSSKYDPRSYHNGSIWPHDTAMIAEGLTNFGYTERARMLHKSLRQAWQHFKTPIELFVYEDGFSEYSSPSGQKACEKQAWSAASILAEL
jgi:glycogen debranching enzyme